MKLSIIIVSWNVEEKLKKNLEALRNSKFKNDYEVFVVDNNSSDGSVEMLRDKFAEIKLIENKENKGFAKANNQAIKKAKGEYVLLLNPDMELLEDTLDKMISWYEQQENVWVAGCHLLSPEGETITHVRKFPAFLDQLAIVLKIPHIFPSVLDEYLRKDFDYSKSAKVDSVRGGFFMINRAKFNGLPLLDERYFLWFEEVDFCKTVKESGGEVWYTNTASCIDLVGQSFSQVKRLRTQRYFRDSMLKYFRKWHGIAVYVVLYLAWIPALCIAFIIDIFNLKGKAKT